MLQKKWFVLRGRGRNEVGKLDGDHKITNALPELLAGDDSRGSEMGGWEVSPDGKGQSRIQQYLHFEATCPSSSLASQTPRLGVVF